ncbi:MAG TPA: DUF86 domain-containing protein [Candidatus Paceibacterota bacterium]
MDDKAYLQHIAEAVLKIDKYTKNATETTFVQDEMMRDAVVREFEIIGEASRRLSDLSRRKTEEIPWSQVIAMRNKLSHEYFGVDFKAVWAVVQRDLSPLSRAVTKLLSEMD